MNFRRPFAAAFSEGYRVLPVVGQILFMPKNGTPRDGNRSSRGVLLFKK